MIESEVEVIPIVYATICKRFTFEASHHIPFHDGKCARPHGHSYKVEVFARGPMQQIDPNNPESGMVVDFYRLGEVWQGIERSIDHQDLNAGTLFPYPTAEFIAMQLLQYFHSRVESVFKIRVHETEDGWAEVSLQNQPSGSVSISERSAGLINEGTPYDRR